jgi:hypothetical protein
MAGSLVWSVNTGQYLFIAAAALELTGPTAKTQSIVSALTARLNPAQDGSGLPGTRVAAVFNS